MEQTRLFLRASPLPTRICDAGQTVEAVKAVKL